MSRVETTAVSFSVPAQHSFYRRFGKRWLDLAGAIAALLFLAPLLLFVALLVRISGPGDIFFCQRRIGLHGITFNIFKFRTMNACQGVPGPLLTTFDDPRITPIGIWLRKTKLDELPQLWNVLRGDMSLVGPRPEVPLYATPYFKNYPAILQNRPGITGFGINVCEEQLLASQSDPEAFYLSTVLPAKLKLDLQYVQKISLRNDLIILLSTPFKIFSGVTAPRNAYAWPAQDHS